MVMNIHERPLPLSRAELGALLETLGSPDDAIWHSTLVEPMMLSDGLAIGSVGGHGPVRYQVIEHVPGHRIVFAFQPGLGLNGNHMFEALPHGDGSVLRHTINAKVTGIGHLTWPLLIRPIHDGALEDMLDHVERAATGTAHRRRPTPAWVRVVGPRLQRRTVTATPPRTDGLLADSLDHIDAVDCWSTPLLPGDSTEPAAWNRAILGREVPWLMRLMALRNALARLAGLKAPQATETGFPLLATSPNEILVGLDDTHLSFRVSILVDDHVSVTTTVQIHHTTGRLYWAVVRWFHGPVVRGLLRSAPFSHQEAYPTNQAT